MMMATIHTAFQRQILSQNTVKHIIFALFRDFGMYCRNIAA